MSIESVLILGIGNTLLSDEGVGVHVVKRMQADYADDNSIEYMDGGTLSFTLAEPIARANGLIVVDAARMNSPPGSVKVFHNDDMDTYLSGNRQSVHEVSLSDLLDIARLTDSLPESRSLVGIEPLSIDWGESLSDQLQHSVDRAVTEILAIISGWDIVCRRK
ncbi:MAG: HyaD/HybD family hydrogenase maturation endopeptidase [Pseudomonadota bacterium]